MLRACLVVGLVLVVQAPKGKPTASKPKDIRLSIVIGPNLVMLSENGGRPFKVRLIGLGDGSQPFPDADSRRLLLKNAKSSIREATEGRILAIERDPKFPTEKDGTIPAYILRDKEESLNSQLLDWGCVPADRKTWAGAARLEALSRAETRAKDGVRGVWDEDFIPALRRARNEAESDVMVAKNPAYEYRPVNGIPKPGTEVYLFDQKGETIYGCDGLFAWEDYVKFKKAKDETGLAELISGNRIIRLDPKTRVKFLESKHEIGLGAAEVRILDGEFKGTVIWVGCSALADHVEVVPPKGRNR